MELGKICSRGLGWRLSRGMFDGLLDPSWSVIFGISLSLALFAIKFVTARSPKFDDMVVGLADIPTVLTASACSLLVVVITKISDWHVPGSALAWLLVIFIINVCIFRYVESRKRSLASSWPSVAGLIAISMAVSILLSFNLVSYVYASAVK